MDEYDKSSVAGDPAIDALIQPLVVDDCHPGKMIVDDGRCEQRVTATVIRSVYLVVRLLDIGTDENGQAFFKAFGAGQPPDPEKPRYSYMLQGGSGWSNTDPMAEKLPPDRKDYIHIPPHFMILDSKMANEAGLPLHDPDPDTHYPFVMFGWTPYAILIIPVQ